MRSFDLLVIHHTASPRNTTMEKVRQWHLDKGWMDIGYHKYVEVSGKVREGRPLHMMGAHCRHHNAQSIGIAVAGDNTKAGEEWNGDQIDALRAQVAAFKLVWPEMRVCGHRDLVATQCPGLDIEELL